MALRCASVGCCASAGAAAATRKAAINILRAALRFDVRIMCRAPIVFPCVLSRLKSLETVFRKSLLTIILPASLTFLGVAARRRYSPHIAARHYLRWRIGRQL